MEITSNSYLSLYFDSDDEDYDGPAAEIEKHYWILPSTLEANTLEEAKEEIENLVSDRLSNDEGYCHDGFKIDIKEPFNKACAQYLMEVQDAN